jgi:type IV fimbrial biogenesis protein FimT
VLVMPTRTLARTPARGHRGVTAIEILVVLVIVAMLSVAAGPSLASAMVAQRLRAAGTDLVAALLLARSEAIKRNANVTVRPAAGDDWGSGWVTVTINGDEIDHRNPPGQRVSVSEAPTSIVYGPNGRLAAGGSAQVEFVDALSQAGVSPRCVTVDTAGLPRLGVHACS